MPTMARDRMGDEFWSHFEQRRATWRDGGPRADLFTSMSESERAAIEARLLHMLSDPGNEDEWVAMALGDLRSVAAVPGLQARMHSAGPEYRVAAAAALWHIGRDPSAVSAILSVLFPSGWLARRRARRSAVPSARIAAVVALRGIDHPEAARGLERARRDHNFFVRANAERGHAPATG